MYATETDECTVDGIPVDEFISSNQEKSEIIRTNLLNHRGKNFIKHIVMSKLSLMAVSTYSYEVEFQFRGQHIVMVCYG